MLKKYLVLVCTIASLVTLAGCSSKNSEGEVEAVNKEVKEEVKEETKKEPEVLTRLSASHILVMHTESKGTTPLITRTKDEALAVAKLIKDDLAAGKDFGELAKKYSDCPSKEAGGDLGSFPPEEMTPEFSDAIKIAKIGEITDPVETPFGYHIIKRQKAHMPETLAASLIVVLHEKSMPNPIGEKRTKEEAKKKIEEALAKIKAGEEFSKVAQEYSDHPSKQHGGHMGNFESDKMPPDIIKTIKGLQIGETAKDAIETPLGFHIYKRQEVVESIKLNASMILVAHKDSKPNFLKATRTKEEAYERAMEIIEKLGQGADFVELAKEYSDHPSKVKGGSLGVFKSDHARPEIVGAVKGLEIGGYSKEPMELGVGYHVWLRKSPDEKETPMKPIEGLKNISL